MENIYEFFYPDKNIRQRKIMISHDAYLEYRNMKYDTDAQIKRAKEFLKYHTKGMEYFTDKSSYFDAIESGYVETTTGKYKTIVTKIEDDE